MSTVEATAPRNYLNATYGLWSWLTTKDHKRIGILYAISITLFFLIGGIMATLIRLELATPAGDLLQPDTYNRVFTMHGIMMVFFFLIPSVPATLGNFLLPVDAGREGRRVPEAQPRELVHLHDRRLDHALGDGPRRRRHRLDVLHARTARRTPTPG
jgi:cytochrome c oxidase subunit 1